MIRKLLFEPGPYHIVSPYAVPECWIPWGARLTVDPRLPDLIAVTHFVRKDHLAEAIRLIASDDGVASDDGAAPPPESQPLSHRPRLDRIGRPHLRLIR